MEKAVKHVMKLIEASWKKQNQDKWVKTSLKQIWKQCNQASSQEIPKTPKQAWRDNSGTRNKN